MAFRAKTNIYCLTKASLLLIAYIDNYALQCPNKVIKGNHYSSKRTIFDPKCQMFSLIADLIFGNKAYLANRINIVALQIQMPNLG